MRARRSLSLVSACLVALATVGCDQVVEESRERIQETREQILGSDACFADGEVRTGVLEASLVGVMAKSPSGNTRAIEIPDSSEPNRWSQKEANGPNKFTSYPVFNAKDNQIRVPAGEIALIWFEVEPPPILSGSSPTPDDEYPTPTDVRFVSNLSDRFQTAPGSKLEGSNIVMLCDDNRGNPEDHKWEFGLKIDGEWYDPQIKNLGNEPPPPPYN